MLNFTVHGNDLTAHDDGYHHAEEGVNYLKTYTKPEQVRKMLDEAYKSPDRVHKFKDNRGTEFQINYEDGGTYSIKKAA